MGKFQNRAEISQNFAHDPHVERTLLQERTQGPWNVFQCGAWTKPLLAHNICMKVGLHQSQVPMQEWSTDITK